MATLLTPKPKACVGRQSPPPREAAESKVAFIVSRFPKLSETFVLYEILALEKMGIQVEIFPLIHHHESAVNGEAKKLSARAHYEPFLSLPILRAQWHYFRRSPAAYLKLLMEILRGTFGAWNFLFRALAIFPKAARFAREMEEQGITHIHAHFANHPATAGFIIHRLTGIPFSFTARGSDIQMERRFLKEKVGAADFVVTVSAFNKEVIVKECGEQVRDKIHVIYGGVDIDLLSPRAMRQRTGPFQILCIARFCEVKGHADLIQACEILKQRGVRFECHLIGEGPLLSSVAQQISSAGLTEKVLFHGALPHEEVVKQFAAADVAVLATAPTSTGECEGIPNVLKEAMACGLPVVSSLSGGIPELVDDGITGILVPPRDPPALADALQRLCEDPELRQRIGCAGRKRIVRDFNLRVSSARRADIYLGRADAKAWSAT
jgi:colanic acid/amylovoran biosynthesis glycosyltransferase